MSNKVKCKIHAISTRNWLIRFCHGTFITLRRKTGVSYIIQFTFKNPWMIPHKDIKYMNGRYTLYGWLFLYFGYSNVNHLEIREIIANIYNHNRMLGLKYMEKFMKENKKTIHSLQIQQDNMNRNCHVAPELYEKDMADFLSLYGYKCDDELNIVSYYDIPLLKNVETI